MFLRLLDLFKAVWIPVYFQAVASGPSFLVVEISFA